MYKSINHIKMKVFRNLFACILGFIMVTSTTSSTYAQQKDNIKEVKIWASMHCQSCQKKIEREIAFEKGVKSIIVDLNEKTVTIKYNADKNTDEKLAEAIKKLGYDTKILNKEEKKKEGK